MKYPAMDPILAARLEARDEREWSKRMQAAIELGRKADAALAQWLEEADATWADGESKVAHMKNPDLWREMHRPSVDNPVCECAGGHVCCPCTLSDALQELARLRASHARLLEALRAILDDPEAGINITLIARAAIAEAEGGGE